MTLRDWADIITFAVFVCYAVGLLLMFGGLVWQMWNGRSPIESRAGGRPGAISLSKLQMYLWTLVLAFAWLYQLVRHPGEFPELPNQALLLMGISGAAYLGAKPIGRKRDDDNELPAGELPIDDDEDDDRSEEDEDSDEPPEGSDEPNGTGATGTGVK